MNTSAAPIVTPPHIYYFVVRSDLTLTAWSAHLPEQLAEPGLLHLHNPISSCLPELCGCEDIMAMILADPTADFRLPGVTRIDPVSNDNCYFDLYIQHYQSQPDPMEPQLLIFAEDVTDKMALEQVLVQSTNETTLLLNALTHSRNYIHQIVTSIADALIVTTPEHHIKTINNATSTLFGYTEAELLDQPIASLFVHPEVVLPRLEKFRDGPATQRETLEILCKRRDGSQLMVALSCSLVHPPAPEQASTSGALEQEVPSLVYIGRDVTERQRTQQRLAAQYAIASILSESVSLDSATHRILEAIGQSLKWDVGEFWVPADTRDRKVAPSNLKAPMWFQTGQPCPVPVPKLQRVDYWLSEPKRFKMFVGQQNRARLNEGVIFAGQVWSAGCPQWITALYEHPDFGRSAVTVQAGLHSAFAFPLHSGHEMLGVMTFFRSQQQSPDEHLLQMMTATGNQLGQFIKRKEAELALQKQQAATESLLLNILPNPIVDRLKQSSETIADSFEEVTVLFADLVGFTKLASRLSPIDLVEQLNIIFSAFDQLTEQHRLEKIKTIGDAYMVVGGLPTSRPDHAEAIANMALDMQAQIKKLDLPNQEQVGIRVGINTGSVVAGVIGIKKFSYDLWGDAVNIASRMESHGLPGQIQVTEATYQQLRDRYTFTHRGKINIKGKGAMETYWLTGRAST